MKRGLTIICLCLLGTLAHAQEVVDPFAEETDEEAVESEYGDPFNNDNLDPFVGEGRDAFIGEEEPAEEAYQDPFEYKDPFADAYEELESDIDQERRQPERQISYDDPSTPYFDEGTILEVYDDPFTENVNEGTDPEYQDPFSGDLY